MKKIKNKINDIEEFLFSKKKFEDRNIEKIFIDTYINDLFKQKSKDIGCNPIWVGLKLTSECNMNCVHCWVDEKRKKPSMEEIENALNKFLDLEILHVTLSGGEPFLRMDILEIIKKVKEKGFLLEIFSNGSILDEELVSKIGNIIDKKTDTIQISLDASNKTIFEKQRNSKLFKKIVNNIKLLKKEEIIVRVNFTATAINMSEILNTYKLCEELGVDTFSVSYVFDSKRAKNLYKNLNLKMFIKEIHNCIEKNKNFKTNFRLFIPVEFYANKANYEKQDKLKLKQINYENILFWSIQSNGDIYPNVTLEYPKLKIGNIYSDSVKDLELKHKEIGEKVLKRNLESTKCEFCSEYKKCMGGDFARSYRSYRNFDNPDSNCFYGGV